MNNCSKLLLSTLLAAAAVGTASAQSAGAKVSDTQGGEVGTIASADGDFVILKTDKHEVRLPKTSFTAHQGGYVIAMTRAQVNAAVEQSLGKKAEALAVGAVVRDPSGATVGTIDSLDDSSATIKIGEARVQLPLSAIGTGPNGAAVSMSAAELQAQAAAAAGQPAADEPATTDE